MINNNPQRIAWITLFTGFAVFCVICASVLWLAQYVLFDWTTNLNTSIHVSRGTIGILSPGDASERTVRDQEFVEPRDQLRTDEQSQGSLVFADPSDIDKVIAMVQLLGGSEARLRQASRPRFLGDAPYSIRLTQVSGNLQIVVAPGLDRGVRVEVEGDQQAVRLESAGLYLLDFGVDRASVTVEHGRALLINRHQEGRAIEPGQVGLVNGDEISLAADPRIALVQNSHFEEPGAERVPVAWGCNSEASRVLAEDGTPIPQPRGEYERVVFQGQPAVHLARLSEQELNHADTKCLQPLNLDVREYDSIVIRASMYLAYHELSGCGQQASECVLMLRMRFRNQGDVESNNVSEWIHGFYIHYDERSGYPLRCNSCIQDHEHVNGNAWFTFESEDLVEGGERSVLRPVEILDIEFYSSGHAYEAYIGEVSIIARKDSDQEILGSLPSG